MILMGILLWTIRQEGKESIIRNARKKSWCEMMKVFPGIDFHQKKWKEWKKKNNFKSQYVIRLTQKYFLCFLSLSFIESHLMVSDRANIKWKETCLLDCLEGVKLFTFFFLHSFVLFSFNSKRCRLKLLFLLLSSNDDKCRKQVGMLQCLKWKNEILEEKLKLKFYWKY